MHWGKRLIDKSVILCVLQHYYCVLKENYVKHIMFPLFAHTLPIMCKWDYTARDVCTIGADNIAHALTVYSPHYEDMDGSVAAMAL